MQIDDFHQTNGYQKLPAPEDRWSFTIPLPGKRLPLGWCTLIILALSAMCWAIFIYSTIRALSWCCAQ